MENALLFCIAFINVGLIGIQTRVLMTDNYKAVFILSLSIAFSSYFVYVTAVNGTLLQYMLTFGLGGAIGIALSNRYKTQIETFIKRYI